MLGSDYYGPPQEMIYKVDIDLSGDDLEDVGSCVGVGVLKYHGVR